MILKQWVHVWNISFHFIILIIFITSFIVASVSTFLYFPVNHDTNLLLKKEKKFSLGEYYGVYCGGKNTTPNISFIKFKVVLAVCDVALSNTMTILLFASSQFDFIDLFESWRYSTNFSELIDVEWRIEKSHLSDKIPVIIDSEFINVILFSSAFVPLKLHDFNGMVFSIWFILRY